uniref:Uncharacterized protein n=1 Tax=Asterionellopsis glacialis TaxID=33640 RepID=A0A7S0KYN1_9STRA
MFGFGFCFSSFGGCQCVLPNVHGNVPQHCIIASARSPLHNNNHHNGTIHDAPFGSVNRRHQGTSWLLVLQIVLKVYFSGFFVLMFAYNEYAAVMLAATYFFAWIIHNTRQGWSTIKSSSNDHLRCISPSSMVFGRRIMVLEGSKCQR